MTIIESRLKELPTMTLAKGPHRSFEEGHCFNETVAWLAGEPHSEKPGCVSPVIRAFTMSLNDQWDDGQRQKLLPFVDRVVGTAGDGKDEARSYLALDWLVRTYTPAFLDLANLSVEAQALRGLRQIVDLASAEAAGPVVRAGRGKAAAARAAWAAAAAWAARAAWAAAADAGDAAWAAWAAGADAARAAGADGADGAAAAAAAWAAWAAAADAGDAARAADAAWAGSALAHTVAALQASALELLAAMIDPEVS